MTDQRPADRLFLAWLESEAPTAAPLGLLDRIDTATRTARPRPAWVARLEGHHMDVIEGGRRTAVPRLGLVLALIALIIAAAAVAAFIASQQPSLVVNPSPSPDASASPSVTADASLEPSSEPAPARFVAAGSLIDDRFQHAATILSDGRVLVTGGSRPNGAGVFSSTEIWDPTTNSTTASGSIDPGVDPLIRTLEGVLLLPDGRVLLVPNGCWCNPMPAAPAEVWDPSSGVWRAIDSLTIQRVGRGATVLTDGRVLITGGVPNYRGVGGGASADAFIWDPVLETSTPTGSMLAARALHSATLLDDGRVLVVGGNLGVLVAAPEDLVTGAETWDPRTGSFSALPRLSGVRGTAITLLDGRVLIVNETSAVLWDPRDDSVTDAGLLAHPRDQGRTATLLADGRVLIVGGYGFDGTDQPGDPVLEAELWDAGIMRFEAAGSLSEPRSSHTTTALPDGRALIVGGQISGSPAELIEVWEPTRG